MERGDSVQKGFLITTDVRSSVPPNSDHPPVTFSETVKSVIGSESLKSTSRTALISKFYSDNFFESDIVYVCVASSYHGCLLRDSPLLCYLQCALVQ